MGKIVITREEGSSCKIVSELQEQDLYEAYVALTAHIAKKLNSKEDIKQMAYQASIDALNILNMQENNNNNN